MALTLRFVILYNETVASGEFLQVSLRDYLAALSPNAPFTALGPVAGFGVQGQTLLRSGKDAETAYALPCLFRLSVFHLQGDPTLLK